MVRAVAKYALAVFVIAAAGYLASASLRDEGAAEPPRAPDAAPVPVAVRTSDLAPTPPSEPQPPRAAVAPASVGAEPERDEFRSWSDGVAVLPKDLGEMGPSLKLGLDNARNNDMAFCFRELEDGGRGSRATDFVLYLETRQDAVDVVEARVARPGALPPSVVECARDVLRGLEVKVFFAVPGRHFRYVYEVEG